MMRTVRHVSKRSESGMKLKHLSKRRGGAGAVQLGRGSTTASMAAEDDIQMRYMKKNVMRMCESVGERQRGRRSGADLM